MIRFDNGRLVIELKNHFYTMIKVYIEKNFFFGEKSLHFLRFFDSSLLFLGFLKSLWNVLVKLDQLEAILEPY